MTSELVSTDIVGEPTPEQIFRRLKREDIEHAMRGLDGGVSHQFGPSSTYDVLHQGKRYPPKAVIALAVKHRSGTELTPADFPGGEGTAAFDTLRQLGFEIVRHLKPDL